MVEDRDPTTRSVNREIRKQGGTFYFCHWCRLCANNVSCSVSFSPFPPGTYTPRPLFERLGIDGVYTLPLVGDGCLPDFRVTEHGDSRPLGSVNLGPQALSDGGNRYRKSTFATTSPLNREVGILDPLRRVVRRQGHGGRVHSRVL